MAELVAETGVPWVLMHWRGHSREMYAAARYGDVVTEVCAELTARVEDVVAAGVAPEQLVLDPGLGFAKNAEHNWALLAGLDRLIGLGPAGAGRRLPQDLPRPAARRTPTARRGRPRSATPRRWPPPCSPPRPAPGASACTTPPPRSTPSARVAAVRAARGARRG